MTTIVSVTPVQVTADSRTFKMAASFARFGFGSIVVEGIKSNVQPESLPFALIDVKEGVIFSGARGANESSEKPSRSIIVWFKYWLMRLRKPFLNQYHTFMSLPRASLYYLHSFYQFPAVYIKSKLLGVPFVYDAHDYYLAENPGKLNRLVEILCIKCAAAVVTVSRGVADLLLQEYGRTPIVIRNCHDARLEEEPILNLRQSLSLSVEDFLIVVVGQAKDGMAVAEAIEAMKGMLSNVHLAFLGKNTQIYETLVNQANLPSHIHLVPPVKPEHVVPFIRSADAAMILYYPLTPNYENCLPNGFFQSVSAELPTLYPDLPEISQLANEYRLGLSINPKSPDEIRRGIMQLVNERGFPYKQNLIRARQDLSWEKEETVLRNLVEEVLSLGKRSE